MFGALFNKVTKLSNGIGLAKSPKSFVKFSENTKATYHFGDGDSTEHCGAGLHNSYNRQYHGSAWRTTPFLHFVEPQI